MEEVVKNKIPFADKLGWFFSANRIKIKVPRIIGYAEYLLSAARPRQTPESRYGRQDSLGALSRINIDRTAKKRDVTSREARENMMEAGSKDSSAQERTPMLFLAFEATIA